MAFASADGADDTSGYSATAVWTIVLTRAAMASATTHPCNLAFSVFSLEICALRSATVSEVSLATWIISAANGRSGSPGAWRWFTAADVMSLSRLSLESVGLASMNDMVLFCGLTFDMSGSRKPAKPAGGCPLDGGVRRHSAFPKRTAYVFQASSTNVPLDWRKVPSGLVMFVKITFRAKSSTCTTVVLFASCHVTKKINSATG